MNENKRGMPQEEIPETPLQGICSECGGTFEGSLLCGPGHAMAAQWWKKVTKVTTAVQINDPHPPWGPYRVREELISRRS